MSHPFPAVTFGFLLINKEYLNAAIRSRQKTFTVPCAGPLSGHGFGSQTGYQQEYWRVSVINRHPVAQKMMGEVMTVDIAAYRDDCLSQVNPRTEKAISGNSVRLELALQSALYNLAKVEWGTCRTNPMEMVRKPKPSPGLDRRLTSSEERRLSKYFKVRNTELYTIFHLALETGMRQGEILSLQWEHIGLQYGVTHYTRNEKWQCPGCSALPSCPKSAT